MPITFYIIFLFVIVFQEAIGGANVTQSPNGTKSSQESHKHSLDLQATNHTGTIVSTCCKGKRYTAYNTRLSWPQALLFCRRRRKQLATITNEDEHQAVRNKVLKLAKSWKGVNLKKFWIGAGMEGSDWVWATNGKQLKYVLWANGQPKPKQFCLQVNAKDDFKFTSGKCEDKAMFICQS